MHLFMCNIKKQAPSYEEQVRMSEEGFWRLKLNTKMKIVHGYIHIREMFQALRSGRESRPVKSVQTEELFSVDC